MVPITDNDLALFRERAKTELESTGDIGRLAWDDVVEALCKEVARLRSVSKERGDCAKLREVCEKMLDLLTAEGFEDGGMSIELDEKQVIMWRNRFHAALSAPPRNCDRFATETDAQIAFLNEVWLIGVSNLDRDPFDGWTNEMKSAYSKWLFATATEKEGGAK